MASEEHTGFAPPNPCIFLGKVSTKVVKRIVKFDFFFLGGGGAVCWAVSAELIAWRGRSAVRPYPFFR